MTAYGPTLPAATRLAETAASRRRTFDAAGSAGRLFSSGNWDIETPMHRPVSDLRSAERAQLATLMSRVAAREAGALKGVYDNTSAKLYGICLRVLGDEAEAEDVLQEVYLTVWRKAHVFDAARASPITWLATIARNRAIDRLRSKRIPATDVAQALNIADVGPSCLDVLEQAEDASRVRHCLGELDERARTMIRSAFFEGLTYSELAAREAVPLPTMKSLIRRGLLRLRGCLER